MPSMLIGIIDFYHFIPLLLILTLFGIHKVSAKQNLFSHTFHLIRMKFDVGMDQFKLIILGLLLSKIFYNKGNYYTVLQTA